MARDQEKAKTNHLQASYPGELVSQDTFYLACIKGIGRIYHQVAGDGFSSFSAAQIYPDKTAKSSSDFVKKFAPVKIGRLLTDGGTEFNTWHEEATPNHEFLEDLSETRDKAYHNQSKTSLNKWLCRKVK